MRAFYDNKPEVLGNMGDGSFRYRWGIKQVRTEIGEGDYITQWACEEVTVWPTLTANKITKAVISEVWPADYEQKLVNEYNAAILGVYDTEKAEKKIAQYRTFLAEREALKAQVDTDCKMLGIM